MEMVASYISQASRRRVVAAVVVGCLTVGAWLASVGAMQGMEMGGRFSVGSFGFFVVLWVLMMAAMMFPSVWPAIAVYGMVVRRRAAAGAHSLGRSAAFVAGYIGVWAAFGLYAFALLAVARASGLDSLSPAELARYVVAPVALAGAVYQVAPFKQSCLRQCRGPLHFFLEHWRDGARGALVMGARHGAYCIGCCWMLMLVLLALGVMSVASMVVVSIAIAVEKLAALALVALVKPLWLPGVGGSGGGVHRMPPMSMP
jgi:predicted metal-binding membrane protein